MNKIFESTLNTRPILEGSLRFIRSDVPSAITASEREWLIANKITCIVDLHTDEERARKVCPLIDDERFEYHIRPIIAGSKVPPSASSVPESYISMVDSYLKETIDLIENSKCGVLYFCNAGKDRTGVVSAILLHKLGKSREYIVRDYLESRENLMDMLSSFVKQHPSIDINVITPKREYIEAFLDWYTEKAQPI